MLEKHIESIGLLTQQKIATASDALRAEIAGQGEQVEKHCREILDLVETEINALDKDFAGRLSAEAENLQASHTAEIAQQIDDRLAAIKDGEPGAQGEQGLPGVDGIDRPLIEPVILRDKDYAKGTVGTYAGGLWISTKQAMGSPQSDALAWRCILDAMDTIDIELQEDGRYEMAVRMSTGRVIRNTLNIPYPEHCGIWEERDYCQGQIVTKGSSFWQAMQDTSTAPPGNDWRQILSAPRGRAGKSIEGPQGKPGRNGRDANLDDDFIADLREMVAQYRGQQ